MKNILAELFNVGAIVLMFTTLVCMWRVASINNDPTCTLAEDPIELWICVGIMVLIFDRVSDRFERMTKKEKETT